MLPLLFKQLLNFWKSLEIRYKIELFIMLVIIFAVISSRLSISFENWLNEGKSPGHLTLLISNFFSVLINISTLSIIVWLIPRQKGLANLLTQPFDSRKTNQVLIFYSLKYLSLYLILLLPVLLVVFAELGLWSAISSFIIISISVAFFLQSFFWMRNRTESVSIFILSGIIFIALYYITLLLFYRLTEYIILFQTSVIFLFLVSTIFIYSNKRIILNLENFVSFQIKTYKKKSLKISNYKLPEIFSQTLQVLFEKEYFSLWRNSRYKKLKIYSFATYILIFVVITLNKPEYVEILITAISCIFIWFHYISRFNEKYTFPEPAWFLQTQPIKFRHLFLAKYLNEIPLIIGFSIPALLALNISHAPFAVQSSSFLLILVFAHIVLFSMINFQLMFFDNARLAVYAFHSSVLLFTIMIFNYPLVGPLIAFSLMIFFFYKNVKFFNY